MNDKGPQFLGARTSGHGTSAATPPVIIAGTKAVLVRARLLTITRFILRLISKKQGAAESSLQLRMRSLNRVHTPSRDSLHNRRSGESR